MPRRRKDRPKRPGKGAKASLLTKYIRPKQQIPQGQHSHRSSVVLVGRYDGDKGGKPIYQFRFLSDSDNDPILHANSQWITVEEEGQECDFFENEGPRGRQPDGSFIEPETKWQESKAYTLLYHDLVKARVPVHPRDDNNKIIMTWKEIYEMRPEYAQYDPDKFDGRLRGVRKIVKREQSRADNDQAAFDLYKANHPVSVNSHYGYVQWQGSEAQKLLKIDIDAGRHNSMKKKALWLSRPEYHNEFPLKVFRDKIDQEERTAKYLHTIKVKGVGKGR